MLIMFRSKENFLLPSSFEIHQTIKWYKLVHVRPTRFVLHFMRPFEADFIVPIRAEDLKTILTRKAFLEQEKIQECSIPLYHRRYLIEHNVHTS